MDWQRCFANVLRSARRRPWLLEMIEHGHETWRCRPPRTLRDSRSTPGRDPVPEATIHRIRAMWRKHHRFTPEQLQSLLEDLAHPRAAEG